MSLRKIFSFSLLLLLVCALSAVNENAGTTGFNNLKIVYSARAMAMARAMTGVDGAIEGLQFNPAAVLNINDLTAASTYCNYFAGSNGGALHLLLPRNENVTYGFMLHYLNLGTMDRTEVTSNNEYLDTGETFGAGDIIAGASAARKVSPAIDVGITLKFIYDKIDTYSASAIMVDAGLVHHPINEKIKVGLSLRNLGRQITYYTGEKYSESLPFTFAAGLSYKFAPKMMAAMDISKPKGSNLTVKFGMEYKLHPMLFLRGGYNSNSADWRTGGDWDWTSGVTLGAGFNWNKYTLDYGLASYGNLGFVNQVTLAYSF
jgi:hypothetical protein